MAPLIALLAVTLIARMAGWLGVKTLRDWRVAVCVGLAAMFLLFSPRWLHAAGVGSNAAALK